MKRVFETPQTCTVPPKCAIHNKIKYTFTPYPCPQGFHHCATSDNAEQTSLNIFADISWIRPHYQYLLIVCESPHHGWPESVNHGEQLVLRVTQNQNTILHRIQHQQTHPGRLGWQEMDALLKNLRESFMLQYDCVIFIIVLVYVLL